MQCALPPPYSIRNTEHIFTYRANHMVRPSVYAPYIFISKPLGTRQAHAKHTAVRGSTLTRDVSTLCSLDTMLVLSAPTRWHTLQSVCAAVPRLCRIHVWRSHSLCTLHSTRCLHAPPPSTTPTQPVVPSLVAGLPPLFLFFGRPRPRPPPRACIWHRAIMGNRRSDARARRRHSLVRCARGRR